MNLFRNIIQSVTASIATRISEFQSPDEKTRMEGTPDHQITNERTAYKIKGFFDLAKQEIAKAIRSEEWGMPDDAISHYKSAQRILFEASSVSIPSYITPRFVYPSIDSFTPYSSILWYHRCSEQEKVKSVKQKISEWQNQVADRLQVLCRRSSAAPSTRKAIVQQPHTTVPNKASHVARKRIDAPESSKPKRSGAYESNLIEIINSTVVDRSPSVKWDDIAGLEKAKQSLLEMVILPTKRRDLFTGLRRPARGLLLFGPPGNGKTMLAKAVASESDATFFNISASALTSKWVGEAEKLVRALFDVAVSRQPSVIFMDEIDSIMSTRMANEHDASRRLKSEFLVQFDGVASNSSDLVIVIGATNKPQELDDAVLRRLVKRIYVPLPDNGVRKLLLKNKLKGQAFSLHDGDLIRLVLDTEGYSGSDLQALCEEAAMMPIRELGSNVLTVKENQVRPLRYEDFEKAMGVIRPSLSKDKWQELQQWHLEFGSN